MNNNATFVLPEPVPSTASPSSSDAVDRRFLLGGLAGAAGITALAAMTRTAAAGPLTPPAGAVASSGKTLTEVEPRTAVNATNTPGYAGAVYRITQPGSYYLTGDVQGVSGRAGIEITASNVTLDLCGFTVRGVAGSGHGIVGGGPVLRGVSVMNGHVVGWGGSGVTFFSSEIGIRVLGIATRGNASNGILVAGGSLVADCIADANGASGIEATAYSTIERCTAVSNGTGIAVGASSMVTGCTAAYNAGDGIRALTRNVLTGNNCTNNATGIRLGNSAAIGSNRVESNFVQLSSVCNYKVENRKNLLIRNSSVSAFGLHWDVATENYANVMVPALAASFTGATGGTPPAPAGYDPNINFTLS